MPRSYWSAVPTPLFIYISQLLREGLIFCISATPHLGTSFPLFHGLNAHYLEMELKSLLINIGTQQKQILEYWKNCKSLGPHLLHLAPDAGDQTQGYESVCVETVGCSHSRPHVQCQGSRLKTQTINCNPSYYLHVSLPLLVTMPTASYYNNELKNIYWP